MEQNAFAALSVPHYAYTLEADRVMLENSKVKEACAGG